VRQLDINRELMAKGTLSRREADDFLAQDAEWTIEIVAAALSALVYTT
jgi:hypothetical protein